MNRFFFFLNLAFGQLGEKNEGKDCKNVYFCVNPESELSGPRWRYFTVLTACFNLEIFSETLNFSSNKQTKNPLHYK